MKRRLLVGLLVSFVLSLLVFCFSSCGGGSASAAKATRDSTRLASRPRRARRGKVADSLAAKVGSARSRIARSVGAKGRRGSLKGLTPEEIKAERKRMRDEKRRLREEIRRKKREEKLALRATRGRGRRSGARRRGSLYDAYTLKGTIAGRYALVGTRRLERGDVIAGKKVIEIGSDRITLEQFGTRFSVRVGEQVERGVDLKRRGGSRTR